MQQLFPSLLKNLVRQQASKRAQTWGMQNTSTDILYMYIFPLFVCLSVGYLTLLVSNESLPGCIDFLFNRECHVELYSEKMQMVLSRFLLCFFFPWWLRESVPNAKFSTRMILVTHQQTWGLVTC